MDDPRDGKNLTFKISSLPIDFDALMESKRPLTVSLGSVVQEKPTYIRDVTLEVGAQIRIVTTPALKRGHIPLDKGHVLFLIERQDDNPNVAFTFVGRRRNKEDADAWIAEQ